MKQAPVLLLLLVLALTAAAQPEPCDPAANPEAIVTAGNARFTVLTPRLIRMEWAADGHFEDHATLGIVNRRLPVPEFKHFVKDSLLTITTDQLTLRYRIGRPFDSASLRAEFRMAGRKVVWHHGKDASANLLGTTRTLDGCEGFSRISYRDNYMDPGVLSRDGWAVIDESARHLLVPDSSDWGQWVAPRPEGQRQDLYLFAYGHDYTTALRDFSRIAGRIPLPPLYTFGYWWSRYWIYTDDEILALAQEMRDRQIPIDVMIVDMDWHETWKPMNERLGRDPFGQRRGWTGYTWNRDLFPDPAGFLHQLHTLHFKTALNLHPASGIQPYEECYTRFVADYLQRTSDYDGPQGYVYGSEPFLFRGQTDTLQTGRPGYSAPVPFRIDQQAWADAYFASVIHPLEEQGVDFWWLDWQQWRESRYTDSLSNTFWLNYTFFNDRQRRSAHQGLQAPRPFTYHRWGGLGSHRYPLGFSGDTYDDWAVLQFLPYFTATASNVGYGYWGHDIGGHMQHTDHPTDPELYTRWLQYGVFTPIFKTHSTQSPFLDRRIWSYPSHYEAMKAAITLRYALTPYIYTAAREAYDSGLCICRPMYYAYPDDPHAYDYREQHLFGDRIIATAVCQPASKATGKAMRRIWLPAGTDWYDMALHTMHKGGSTRLLHYSVDENPWYVKAGSILPLAAEGIQNLQEPTNEMRLLIVPGGGHSSYSLYEDDGTTQAYTASAYSRTLIEKTENAKRLQITIHPRHGTYDGAHATRRLSIVIEGTSATPRSVALDGRPLPVATSSTEHSITIPLPEITASEKHVIEIVKP